MTPIPQYNPGLRNHPNFSWNQGGYQERTSASTMEMNPQFSRTNVTPYQNQLAFVNPHSMSSYANPLIPPLGFANE